MISAKLPSPGRRVPGKKNSLYPAPSLKICIQSCQRYISGVICHENRVRPWNVQVGGSVMPLLFSSCCLRLKPVHRCPTCPARGPVSREKAGTASPAVTGSQQQAASRRHQSSSLRCIPLCMLDSLRSPLWCANLSPHETAIMQIALTTVVAPWPPKLLISHPLHRRHQQRPASRLHWHTRSLPPGVTS